MGETKLEGFTPTNPRKHWLGWGLASLVVYGAAALAALELVDRERHRLTEDWKGHLEAIAAQNAEVARLWFFERSADAEVLADSPIVRRALASPQDPTALIELGAVLERVRA
ncbi:MAG: hypothetical protein IT382_22640, partial [Deltaproteobacteria bacterium]|nr:hypothetical protein [Deltaproteobacteria bacterium]